MVKRTSFFEIPNFSDLAKSSEKFVIRKHDSGLFTPGVWWLYFPDGHRYRMPRHAVALKIAIDKAYPNPKPYSEGKVTDARPEARHPKLWQDRLDEVRKPAPLPVADFVRVWDEGYLEGSSDMDNGIDTEDPRRTRNPYRGIL